MWTIKQEGSESAYWHIFDENKKFVGSIVDINNAMLLLRAVIFYAAINENLHKHNLELCLDPKTPI